MSTLSHDSFRVKQQSGTTRQRTLTPRDISERVSWFQVLVAIGADPGRGGRTRCPIHHGTNVTAFSYHEDEHTAHCYSCGWSDDKLAFLQAVRGGGFRDALQMLAGLAGIRLDSHSRPPRHQLQENTAKRAAVHVARQRFVAWDREWTIKLTDSYREVTAELEICGIALRACRRCPDLYSETEAEEWHWRAAELEQRRATLEHLVDFFTFSEHAPDRAALWAAVTTEEAL
jgi:hypothetical protein